MTEVLVIDDEKSIRNTLREILEYENFKVEETENGIQGLKKIKAKNFDVVLCDIKMPGMDGLEVLDQAFKLKPDTPFIMISGHGEIETAVEAIKKGAFDYISKPLDLNRLLVSVKNAIDRNNLVEETKELRKKAYKTKSNKIIGESSAIHHILQMIEKVAPTDARVLITGPNGSGKELVANQLHKKSTRKNEAFIEVNCAAIPSELIESELFGHEKGSFTSAEKMKKGKFELADKGTIFLDEIGDMSMSAQAKVLRALQENVVTRVGGEKEIKVNVRVIAATNKDLNKEIKEGRFREDLYHRISVIIIDVPSLNERREDIPLLTRHFLEKLCRENGMALKEISDEAVQELQKVNWTGNIRELRNIIERLIILCDQKISADDVKTFANPKH